MKKEEFVAFIESHAGLISFTYLGKDGDIDPFSDILYGLFYDGQQIEVHSLDEVMNAPFYAGKSLDEIFDQLENIEY